MTKDLEDVKHSIHNKTLALHRMQFTHAVLEKMKGNDKEAQLMKATGKHTLSLCSRIFRLKQESTEIEDQVREVRKRRLALKKEALGKLMEMRAAKKRKEEKMQALQSEMLTKGQGSMEKYLKMVTLVQNVLQWAAHRHNTMALPLRPSNFVQRSGTPLHEAGGNVRALEKFPHFRREDSKENMETPVKKIIFTPRPVTPMISQTQANLL
ncbi:centromere protein H-like [Polyodon spathula]|uniref:centromere protein H-like n=1 Tax=Polyodon spathula TaxID=7913 RepID=UPI001B7EBCA7|nr:centromere protein H-like [Polyodon spathula]